MLVCSSRKSLISTPRAYMGMVHFRLINLGTHPPAPRQSGYQMLQNSHLGWLLIQSSWLPTHRCRHNFFARVDTNCVYSLLYTQCRPCVWSLLWRNLVSKWLWHTCRPPCLLTLPRAKMWASEKGLIGSDLARNPGTLVVCPQRRSRKPQPLNTIWASQQGH